MPVTSATEEVHRDKLGMRRPFNACVARPVGKKEREQDASARKAMRDEWNRLGAKGTWGTTVRRWADVAREAKSANEEVHFGYLLGLCFQKGSELPDNHRDKKMKGRVVYQGNRVVNQNWEAALFQDLGSSPATLEASRACDAYGCVPDHDTEVADAQQAYIQADLKGVPSWVCIPPEFRTAEYIGEDLAAAMERN